MHDYYDEGPDYYEDIALDYIDEIYPEDEYSDAAEEDIVALFEDDKSSVYYVRQLQVTLEKKYFHWITYRTVKYLKDLGKLKKEVREQAEGSELHFYTHPSNRYAKRKINKIEKIVQEYSQEHITRSCGQRAEDLFSLGLMKVGFNFIGKDVNKFKRKEWKKTGHNLDFIFEKDKIYYGCEIKNSLGYIDKDELDIKLDMCDFLKIRPLFIMRMAPKTYIKEIISRGGFALIFKWQLYELSQNELVKKIRADLGLPVDCPKAIYDGTIKRFEDWHKKQKV